MENLVLKNQQVLGLNLAHMRGKEIGFRQAKWKKKKWQMEQNAKNTHSPVSAKSKGSLKYRLHCIWHLCTSCKDENTTLQNENIHKQPFYLTF